MKALTSYSFHDIVVLFVLYNWFPTYFESVHDL